MEVQKAGVPDVQVELVAPKIDVEGDQVQVRNANVLDLQMEVDDEELKLDAGWDQDEDVQIEFDEAKLLSFLKRRPFPRWQCDPGTNVCPLVPSST